MTKLEYIQALEELIEELSVREPASETGQLTYNLSDYQGRLAHKRAVNSTNAYIALYEISQRIFRPARKHGYKDTTTNELLENLEADEDGNTIVDKLESMFWEILEDSGINMGDLE